MPVILKFRLLILALLSLSAFAGTWSNPHTGVRNGSCTAGSAGPCGFTLTAVAGGTGDVVVIFVATQATSAITIASATFNGSTLTLIPGSGCSSQIPSGGAGNSDCAYFLNPVAGSTTVQVTLSSAPAGTWYAGGVELLDTVPICLDTYGISSTNTASTSQVGPTLTLTGSNDAIAEGGRFAGLPSALSGGYTNAFPSFVATLDAAYLLNTNSGTALIWTTASGKSAISDIAFKDTGCSGVSGSQWGGPNKLGGAVQTQ